MTRRRRVALLAALLAAAAFVACTLNPQPLPPRDDEGARASDDFSDAGVGFGTSADAAPPAPEAEGGNASDGGPDAVFDAPVDGPLDAPADGSTDADSG